MCCILLVVLGENSAGRFVAKHRLGTYGWWQSSYHHKIGNQLKGTHPLSPNVCSAPLSMKNSNLRFGHTSSTSDVDLTFPPLRYHQLCSLCFKTHIQRPQGVPQQLEHFPATLFDVVCTIYGKYTISIPLIFQTQKALAPKGFMVLFRIKLRLLKSFLPLKKLHLNFFPLASEYIARKLRHATLRTLIRRSWNRIA